MDELGAILETGAVAAVEAAASAVAERGGQTPPCANCGKPLIGPYCAVCGQPLNTHRRTLGHLLHEFFHDIFSFDSRILRTARALMLRPGELPRAFREGRTQPYVPAVRLYLFVTLLFFLFLAASGLTLVQFVLHSQTVVYSHDAAGTVFKTVDGKTSRVDGLKSDAKGNMSLVDPSSAIVIPDEKADGVSTSNAFSSGMRFFQPALHNKNQVSPSMSKALAKLRSEAANDHSESSWLVKGIATTLSRLETDPAALNGPLTSWVPRILFVLLPMFALLLALFYRGLRREFLFVDHLVFSLTMHSFAFVLFIAAAILAQFMAGGTVALLTWAVLSLYFLLSLKWYYGQGWIRTGFKFAGISIVYFMFFLMPALGVAIVASVVSG